MKEFFARLNPTERRFVVGVAVVFFLVINIVWVWPHFSDWGQTKGRMAAARGQLMTFQLGTNLIPELERKIAIYRGQGQMVPTENQALNFVRTIQNETTKVGIIPQNMNPTRQSGPTNSFFVDQGENMTLDTTEKQLVDFLYNLGSSTNAIRVKVLSVQPDPSHQRLSTRATLVASYQKKAVGSVGAAAPVAGQKRAPAETKPATTAAPTTPANTKPTTPAPNNTKPATPGTPKLQATNRVTRTTNTFVSPARPGQPTPNKQ
jgi:hypothetical protein